ncbi:YdeI/OmpD-associated family protein [Echinicola shivajiensis]|uniref:YdeI/OmpD-associated family protein n=1 Tax=Echinicola shivajiensis TaxID=1035916 RepID=UPI001BFC734D|nr:YdeI/OmpD-associated family protein [Echinicola shivajiensis]
MNNKIDNYLSEGCGRCALGGTPDCKVHKWTKELLQLRRIVLDCELTEELKWSVPCYTYRKKNILIISAFKDYAALNFFKGALLQDRAQLLEKPGENSQAGRLIKFTDINKILDNEPRLKAYIFEAIEVENEGLEVPKKTTAEYHVPEELQEMLETNTDFKAAFRALTPGRQKGYLLHFSQAKQSKTRLARIEKCMSKIFEGKGFNDR